MEEDSNDQLEDEYSKYDKQMADQLGITSSEKFIMRSAELQDLQSAGLPKN